MAGLNTTLTIAQSAIAAQQYGLNISGHNIANVSNPNYSRQSAVQESKQPTLYGSMQVGSGVDVDNVLRLADSLLDERLMSQKSVLSSYEESSSYMNIIESLFSSDSDSGISSTIAGFWNTWHDLSNYPTGSSERIAVYDYGVRMSEEINFLHDNLEQIEEDLTGEIDAGVSQLNSILKEIANINKEISSIDASINANDQKDERNGLVKELSELIEINSFEQSNGSLTILTSSGQPLVAGLTSYKLELDDTQVIWKGSGGNSVDITDKIDGGKIGGWLDMRDEVCVKYRNDLDSLSKEIVWEINKIHSQGVGLDFFSTPLTGTYSTDSSGLLSTLSYGERIDNTKDFKVWVQDNSTIPSELSSVEIDMGISEATISNVVASDASDARYRFTVEQSGTVGIDDDNPIISWEKLNTDGIVENSGSIVINNAGTFNFDGGSFDIGQGTLVGGNTFTMNFNESGESDPSQVKISGLSNSVLSNYTFKVSSVQSLIKDNLQDVSSGAVGEDRIEIEWSNGSKSGKFILEESSELDDPLEEMSIDVDGMQLTLSGSMFVGDVFTIETDDQGRATASMQSEWNWTIDSFKDQFNSQSSFLKASVNTDNTITFSTVSSDYSFAFAGEDGYDCGLAAALGINTFFQGDSAGTIAINEHLIDVSNITCAQLDSNGEYGVGDNSNSLAIADLQYKTISVSKWTFESGKESISTSIETTIEGYYQELITSLGIISDNIVRGSDYSELVVESLTEQISSISGVSLDEEMISLIEYQQAYTAAAKLLTTTDEMMDSLLSIR